MMQRLPRWEDELAAYIERQHTQPHAYGEQDCLLFVAGAVEAVTGEDFAADHRGQYDSALSAARYLKELGYDSPEEMIDAHLPAKPIGFAQRGDIVLAEDGIPAVCFGDFALSLGEEGALRVPRAQWVKAWGVGEQFADYEMTDE